jgi:hypothetical protein
MKHVVPHGLGQEKAKQVAQAAFDSNSQRYSQYNPSAKWVDDRSAEITFKVKGMKLEGRMNVNPNDIEMELDVPFLLKPFKGKALGVIEDEIKKWISKAQAGEI